MNILYHHRTRAEDAQGIHIHALCKAFRDLGHEVRLVGPPRLRDHDDGRATHAAGTRILGLRVPSWAYELTALAYNVPAFIGMVAVMLRRRPDLVYERYALFAVAGRLAAGLFRVPFVLEVNAPLSLEMDQEQRLAFRRLAQRIEDWLCSHSTCTIVVSRAMARILAGRGTPPERLWVMPNGVDRSVFRPDIDGVPGRRELGLEGAFVIGFVGWVRPWHGVDVLIRAASSLCEQIPTLVVLIVGDGPARGELEALAADEGIAERVRFTGAVDQTAIPGYLAAVDVAVQPDVTDYASPIKLFEYLATGRAVVAPRKDNITEVVADGEQALLFPPGDVEQLAACLRRLHDDPTLRTRLGRRGAALIDEREYCWEGNARRVAALAEQNREQPA